MRLLFAVAATALLAGCSSTAVTNTAAVNYVTVSPELAAVASSVSDMSSIPAGAQNLGTVSALACQRLTSDPVPTPEYAAALLKEQVATKGGNAVTEVLVTRTSVVGFNGNCWANITAKGVALRLP